jgi:sulfatase modifying factor 1
MLPLLLLLACTSSPERHRPGELPDDSAPPEADADADSDADSDADADADADTDPGPCSGGMALVDDAFCVDRWEAALEAWDGAAWVARSPYQTLSAGERVRAVSSSGLVPQGYISGDEAEAACEQAGKRLCSSAEWLAACRGPQGLTYPYGDGHIDGACNDAYAGGHPVVDYFGTSEGVWDSAHMNDPGINQMAGTVAPGGAYSDCISASGALDLHGNLHEWVADADGSFRGGFYADASINGAGCGYVTTAHDRGYHDYSTGFRCCAEPEG